MSSTPQQRRPAHHSLQQVSTYDMAYPSPPWSDEGTTQFTVPMYDYEATHSIHGSQVVLPYPPSPITRCSSLALTFGHPEEARYYQSRNVVPMVQHLSSLSTGPPYPISHYPQEARVASIDPRDVLRSTASLSPQINIKRSSSEAPSLSLDVMMHTQLMPRHETTILTSTANNTSVMQPKPIHPPVTMAHLNCPECVIPHEDATSAHATPSQPMRTLEPPGLLHSLKFESASPSLQDIEQEADRETKAEQDTKKDLHLRQSQWTDADSASFVCTTCVPPRSFVRKWNLTQHLETHDRERDRPFKCSYILCNMQFRRAHDLQRHIDGVSCSVASGMIHLLTP